MYLFEHCDQGRTFEFDRLNQTQPSIQGKRAYVINGNGLIIQLSLYFQYRPDFRCNLSGVGVSADDLVFLNTEVFWSFGFSLDAILGPENFVLPILHFLFCKFSNASDNTFTICELKDVMPQSVVILFKK